jgi:hypothetical protein
MEANPYVAVGLPIATPMIPGLLGGAAAYGLLSLNSQTLLTDQLFGAANGASLAIVRADTGIPGFIPTLRVMTLCSSRIHG